MQPTRRHTPGRSGKRRAHQSLKAANLSRCSQCGNAKMPHAACANCGYVNPTVKLEVEEKKG